MGSRQNKNDENKGADPKETANKDSMRDVKSQLEIMGNTSLTAEGCLGVEEYRPETVKLKFESFHLRIFGEDLILSNLHSGSLMVSGRLSGLDFD